MGWRVDSHSPSLRTLFFLGFGLDMVEWRLDRARTHKEVDRIGLERKLRTFLVVWLGWVDEGMEGWMVLGSVTTVDCKEHLAWRLLFYGERGHIPMKEGRVLWLLGIERASEHWGLVILHRLHSRLACRTANEVDDVD